MTNLTTTTPMTLVPSLEAAWRDVDSSFDRFCLTAGIGAIEQMLCEDAQQLAGARHSRGERVGHRWGATKGKLGFHGGKVVVRRPRVRSATATRLRYRPGGRHRPRIGWGAGR
jgi:putative transposase